MSFGEGGGTGPSSRTHKLAHLTIDLLHSGIATLFLGPRNAVATEVARERLSSANGASRRNFSARLKANSGGL